MQKRYLVTFLLTLFLLSGCITTEEKESSEGPLKENHFRMEIIQDGKVVPLVDNGYELERKPFVFRFNIPAPMAVSVNASFKPESYLKTESGEPMTAIEGFKWGGMADYRFNRDKSLLISDLAFNYWYYTAADDHRFDHNVTHGENITCLRTVELISDTNPEEIVDIPVGELKEETIYLSIFSFTRNEEGEPVEKQREYARLMFK